MTQNAKLLTWLQSKPITQLEAFNGLGICRLSERIRELERLGYVIHHESVRVQTREKETTVTRYTLVSEPEERAA